MAMMFNKRSQIEVVIDDLTRELADTRTRCRQLEELLGIGQDDALPSRNEVIARAETDAAIIRVHAQRLADRILDQAEQQAATMRRPSQPATIVSAERQDYYHADAHLSSQRPGIRIMPSAPIEHIQPSAPSGQMYPSAPIEHIQPSAPSGQIYPDAPVQHVHHSAPIQHLHPSAPMERLHPSAPAEAWPGRDEVADLWDIAPDELDASIERFMSTTLERSNKELLLDR